MSKICPNFGHIMDTFWALPCHGDIFWAMCCNCPNNGQEFRHFFGHNQPVWSYFKHILGTNWGLVTFWAHYGHFWGEMCPKCDHPYIVLQCRYSYRHITLLQMVVRWVEFSPEGNVEMTSVTRSVPKQQNPRHIATGWPISLVTTSRWLGFWMFRNHA